MNARQWMVGVLVVLFSAITFAQFIGPGPAMVTTVAQALQSRDDTPVVLEGHITNQIRHEYYNFRDATGTIILDIDDDVFWPARIAPTDKVRIYGKVDREITRVEIEVKRIELISQAAK